MPSSLIVYFDYKSPYAFVAKASIYKLEKDFGLEVEWRPYSLHIPDFLGNVEVDDEGKITHVGIIMTDYHIIHAFGKVRIDRLDQTGIFNNSLNAHTHKLRVIKKIM